MIKWLLCKLNFHKYERTDNLLTLSVFTQVKCERCGKNMPSSNLLTREQIDKKIKKMIKK